MTIDDLKQLMPPPEAPLFPGSNKDWNAFRKKVGLKFPNDYFTVVHTYGSGRFLGGEFKVANPFDPDDGDFADFELTRLRDIKQAGYVPIPYPLFPEPGGLYPIGFDGNGNTYLWITNPDSDEWPIACFNSSEDYHEVVNYSLIEFLVRMATNQLEIKTERYWSGNIESDQLTFQPRRLSVRRKGKPKR